MEIRLISFDKELGTAQVELIVEKNKKTTVFPFTFSGIEQFSFRDIKTRIKADMKADKKIDKNLTELYDNKKVVNHPERTSLYGNISKQ